MPGESEKPGGSDAIGMIEHALLQGEGHTVPDEVLQRVFTAAAKAYAAKVEKMDSDASPFEGRSVTATEAVTTACAMIRAVDLNMFDVALWFNRPGPRT